MSCYCCVCSRRRRTGQRLCRNHGATTTWHRKIWTLHCHVLRRCFGDRLRQFPCNMQTQTATCVRFGLSILLGAACVDFGVKSLCCDNVYRRSPRQRCPTTCLPRCCCTAVDFRGCMQSCWIRPGTQGVVEVFASSGLEPSFSGFGLVFDGLKVSTCAACRAHVFQVARGASGSLRCRGLQYKQPPLCLGLLLQDSFQSNYLCWDFGVGFLGPVLDAQCRKFRTSWAGKVHSCDVLCTRTLVWSSRPDEGETRQHRSDTPPFRSQPKGNAAELVFAQHKVPVAHAGIRNLRP